MKKIDKTLLKHFLWFTFFAFLFCWFGHMIQTEPAFEPFFSPEWSASDDCLFGFVIALELVISGFFVKHFIRLISYLRKMPKKNKPIPVKIVRDAEPAPETEVSPDACEEVK